jgi:hypothetical protein
MFEAWGLVLSHLNTLEGHQELQHQLVVVMKRYILFEGKKMQRYIFIYHYIMKMQCMKNKKKCV